MMKGTAFGNLIKTPGGIILPHEVNGVEDLRKTLLATVKDPRQREFERLRGEGFDSETALELSGASNMDAAARTEMVLTHAIGEETDSIKLVAATNTARAVQAVSVAAAQSLSGATTMAMLRFCNNNARVLGTTAVVAGGAALAAVAGKTVAKTLGLGAGLVMASNVILGTGLLGFSVWRRLRR